MKKSRHRDRLANERGGGIVETLLVLPVLLFTSCVLLFCFYLGSFRMWTHYQIYEALICLNEKRTKHDCQIQFSEGLEVMQVKAFVSASRLMVYNYKEPRVRLNLSIHPPALMQVFLSSESRSRDDGYQWIIDRGMVMPKAGRSWL